MKLAVDAAGAATGSSPSDPFIKEMSEVNPSVCWAAQVARRLQICIWGGGGGGSNTGYRSVTQLTMDGV